MASDLPITVTGAVIAHFRSVTSLTEHVEDRIALREQYSHGWTPGKPGLTVRPDGGSPQQYLYEQRARLECRVYGPEPETCDVIFALLERHFQDFDRSVVDGRAVLLSMVLETAASFLQDPDTNLAMYLFFISASVRTESVLDAI